MIEKIAGSSSILGRLNLDGPKSYIRGTSKRTRDGLKHIFRYLQRKPKRIKSTPLILQTNASEEEDKGLHFISFIMKILRCGS